MRAAILKPKESGFKSVSDFNSKWADRIAYLILVGLLVDIGAVFVSDKSWHDVLTIIADLLIIGGVWGELMFARRARTADDSRVAEAETAVSEANVRVAEAELRLEELRKSARPRDIDREIFNKELEGQPKSRVQIWYLPDISDGFWFASRLSGALIGAGWDVVEPPTPMPEMPPDPDNPISRFVPRAMVAGAQPSGVTVIARGAPQNLEKNPSHQALMFAIALASGFTSWGSSNLSVPEGVLRVIIAAKPDPNFPKPLTMPAPL
jgi:hypothetical protein